MFSSLQRVRDADSSAIVVVQVKSNVHIWDSDEVQRPLNNVVYLAGGGYQINYDEEVQRHHYGQAPEALPAQVPL